MVKRIQHIALILTLLLLGSIANGAWAKVTYHILSLPMTTKQLDGTDHQAGTLQDFQSNVRVEVLRVVSSTLTVGLPFEYKSPLATNYRYYSADYIERTGPNQLYGYNNTTYYFYNIQYKDGVSKVNTTNNANYGDGADGDDNTPTDASVTDGVRLTPGADCVDNIDIYVTYDVKASPDIDLSTTLDTSTGLLSTGKIYNIHLKDRMVVLNQNRQNRPGAVLDGYYTPEQLASDDFSWIAKEGLNNTAGWRYFTFKFGGNDPYNVTIYTAYDKTTTFRGTGQADFSTKDVKDKDKYIQKDVFKEYRGSSFFRLMSAEMNDKNMWLSNEADIQWQEGGSRDNAQRKVVPGYYKGPNDNKSTLYEMSPIFNSFAILNHKSGEGYAFAGSKMNTGTNNWQPRANGNIQFMDYGGNGNNITLVYKAEASVMKVDVYEIKEYVFRVKTPFGSDVDVIGKWSDYSKSETITADRVPDELKRKYVNFTGNFYADAAHNTAVTTFEDAQTNCTPDASGRPVIYVEYEVSGAPFAAIAAADKTTGYATATWYEMTDKDSSGKKIKWDATNSVYKNNGGASEYLKESEFAFIGDPYELRIINRKLTADASANRYVGSDSRTTGTALTNNADDTGAGYKWEIPYDETVGSFTLREFGSTDAYWKWELSEGNSIQYVTVTAPATPTRIKVMEIGKVNYTFKVIDLSGNIAIQATEAITPFTTLTGSANIPETIRSPFLADEAVTFYSAYSGSGRGNLNPSNVITELPGTACDVYVAYTTNRLSSKNIKLIYSEQFNVKLNGEYIYWNSSDNKILSKASPTTGELESGAYLWHLRGRDPYSMRIDNVGYSATLGSPLPTISITVYNTSGDGTSTTETVNNGMFVKVDGGTWGNDKALIWTSDRDQASRFIAMMSNNVGVYEVLAATGTSDYYHIGRASTAGAETKIYSIDTENGGYAHGADQLRFELFGTIEITYHLIDKSGKELFKGEIKSKNPRLALPSDYVSPLVAAYHYYAATDVTRTNGADGIANTDDDIFTLNTSPTPTDLTEAGSNSDIYVFYDVSDFGFGTSYPRLLKFLQPLAEGYYLEDGADKLTATKIQAVYPYCNGDGNLNIYGRPMNEEQMNGGSSTRPRWVWFIESATKDPYHVKIHSKSTISFGGGTHTTYLQTQAVHFNQDANENLKHIVTGANFPGISLQAATEYMILGTTGRYKLVTTAKIAADLDGDGNTTGTGENERRTVTSFEQYWKTYNMLKDHLLNLKSTDEFSTDRTTFVIPDDQRSALATKLEEKGIGGSNWHSYDAIANATRWNGYNDKEGKDGAGKKIVEKLEHWFQTFDMGDGTFNIEDADIPPVLVLLDRHGWEIMRKPLPTSSSDPQRDEKLAALRAFDSPMVKEYRFYNNASKASGCHKYTLRLNDDGSRRDPIKLNGKPYTSTSLADLPPLTASGVVSSGAINDQFVTYTVKEEYDMSYDPSTETASKFIVLQNNQYAKDESSTLTGITAPSSLSDEIIADDEKAEASKTFKQECLWYVQPNSAIDTEMGWPNATAPTYTDEADSESGFDPYNLQLENASTSKFFTISMTKSVLGGGVYTGEYSSTGVTLEDKCISPVASTESHDHSTLQMTNQTFMAVQDENGNMQLMPRFDHTTRINAFTTLAAPLTEPENDHSGAQTTLLIRPLVFDYHIIDNDGNTALRYKTGGEFYPSIPNHFKSPLAEEFKFYYGLAAGDAVASTAEAWENAEVIKQKTATDETDMNTKITALTAAGVPGDYYFKIGSGTTYTYKMVTIGTEITGSFAAAGIQESAEIKVRYTYDEDYDHDHDQILQGRWMTIKLNNLDVQADGTVVAGTGAGVSLYTGSKNVANHEWQWKFLQSPSVSSSNQYKAPDPYAVRLFNRNANKDANPTANPNRMGTAIKVSGKDRFVILAHPDGDYALAAAGNELTYSFLNGAGMSTPSTTAASVVTDASFSTASSYDIADAERLQFMNDVTVNYTYKVITNAGVLAASETQDESTAASRNFEPYLPDAIRTPLLNQDDYLYYGSASEPSVGVYSVIEATELSTLYGLYDDVIYVRYNPYNELKSPYKVPNQMANSGGQVARGSGSNDTSLGLHGNLLYNIVWYDADMMKSNGSSIDKTACGSLNPAWQPTATAAYEWQLEGNDPYAIKIKSIGETDNYIHEATSTTTDLNEAPTTFMILNREGYEYGVLAKTGTPVVEGSASMLSGYGNTLTTSNPNHFIIFALATFKVIYHLVIAPTATNPEDPAAGCYEEIPFWNGTEVIDKKIPGTTQRDLTSGSPAGSTYQLGTNLRSILTSSTIDDRLYCVDAGCISLGAVLETPEVLYRPNVVYKYYIEGVYNATGTEAVTDMNNKYKGHESTTMGDDAGLLGKTVLVNIVYTFNGDLGTNAGSGFVTSVDKNLWYTFEAKAATPKLAQYTGSLQTVSGYATHYTNDYLWTPLGDPYGFKMYNRYMHKNLGNTTTVMTTTTIADNQNIEMRSDNDANSVYELLADESTTAGYFLVHPVVNTDVPKYYMRDNNGTMELSETATEWTFGLSEDVMRPYYEGAGNVGGLNEAGKAAYELADKISDPFTRLVTLQGVVYDHDLPDDNSENYIVHYAPGYYRLHNQPGSESLSTPRYASGYLHDIEKTAVLGGIPMHFYSRKGVSTTFKGEGGLITGFTETPATRGAIPVPKTEYDPSSIFYFYQGSAVEPTSKIQTQGLYVKENKMTATEGEATSFTITDIGGGIVAISGGTDPIYYLRYDQSSAIYDLKYTTVGDESARWCMEPANIQGLMVETHSGGDGYFYTTFCAPYDVAITDAVTNAYICTAWDANIIHPTKVPASSPYAEGKFVPAATPVIIRTTDNTGKIQLTLPNSAPTTPSPSLGCVFTGEYLEQLLATEITSSDKVYAFGLPITGYGLITDSGSTNGNITDVLQKDQAATGVGFYLNANPNKELSEETGLWTPNNRYVLHNKIYYRSGSRGSSVREYTGGSEFIPVIFDEMENSEELQPDGSRKVMAGDNCIYDLQGRRVATEQEVQNGTWHDRLAPGIYILNGRKFSKK